MGIHTESVDEALALMREKLSEVVPDAELQIKAELVCKINKLKRERNALILGHNYMEPALFHTIPDFAGDSLELSRKAAQTDKDIIIFCGVRFMAETAKILSPDKTVLLPAREAGCSLAASITAADIRKLRERFPEAPVVTYVNCYADVKAETDVCCTSSNALNVFESLDARQVMFLPDEYLSKNVAHEAGKSVVTAFRGSDGTIEFDQPDLADTADIIAWRGRCEVHEQFTVEDIDNVRQQFGDVAVVSHPECSPEVVQASDYSNSTSKIISYVQESKAPRFLILTECSMGDNIIAANPDKDVLRLCSVRCPHMNQITLEDTLWALEETKTEIHVPEDIRVKALQSVERMLAIPA